MEASNLFNGKKIVKTYKPSDLHTIEEITIAKINARDYWNEFYKGDNGTLFAESAFIAWGEVYELEDGTFGAYCDAPDEDFHEFDGTGTANSMDYAIEKAQDNYLEEAKRIISEYEAEWRDIRETEQMLCDPVNFL